MEVLGGSGRSQAGCESQGRERRAENRSRVLGHSNLPPEVDFIGHRSLPDRAAPIQTKLESMSTTLPALSALLLAAGLTACSAYEPPPGPGAPEKVAVCHKGKKTLYVAEPALEAHLGHGDRRGPCP